MVDGTAQKSTNDSNSNWRSRGWNLVILSGFVCGILIAAFSMDNPRIQHPVWTVPFLSGASNFEWRRGWVFDAAEIDRFKTLTAEEKANYRSRASSNVQTYALLAKGFLYVVLIARALFFWMGDLRAVEWLQIIVHVALTLLVSMRFPQWWQRLAFYLLYGINPLVLYVVTFPYYYFWQVIPTAILACYLIDAKFRFRWAAPAIVPLLAWSFLIRPSTIFVAAFLFGFILIREQPVMRCLCFAVAVICALQIVSDSERSNAQPWHTIYIGIGAYPNPQLSGLSDDFGMDKYQEVTGDRLTFGANGTAYEPGAWHQYHSVMRDEYLKFARKHPLLLIRNAIFNYFQSFSIGYISRSLTLSYLSSAIGLGYFLLLLWRRQFGFVAAISLNSISFTLYYPPVPVYMFGAYVLLVAALICTARELFDVRKLGQATTDSSASISVGARRI